MLAKTFSVSPDTSAPSADRPLRASSEGAPASDDGAQFAISLVLVVTTLLVLAAAAAEWIDRLS